ncbi:hypothetical protein CCL21_18360 [Pseudomonas syringae]|nr:hypothetical protein CCL21_18360 [Pseudomonas syringae]
MTMNYVVVVNASADAMEQAPLLHDGVHSKWRATVIDHRLMARRQITANADPECYLSNAKPLDSLAFLRPGIEYDYFNICIKLFISHFWK